MNSADESVNILSDRRERRHAGGARLNAGHPSARALRALARSRSRISSSRRRPGRCGSSASTRRSTDTRSTILVASSRLSRIDRSERPSFRLSSLVESGGDLGSAGFRGRRALHGPSDRRDERAGHRPVPGSLLHPHAARRPHGGRSSSPDRDRQRTARARGFPQHHSRAPAVRRGAAQTLRRQSAADSSDYSGRSVPALKTSPSFCARSARL